MRTIVLGMVIAVSACTTDKSEIKPGLLWSMTENTPSYAFVPGTEIELLPTWAAWCTTSSGIGEGTTTETCDEQDFVTRVTCSGAPCEIEPAAAGTPAGLKLDGSGKIIVRATAPGELVVDVELEHSDTHEKYTRRGNIAIRDLERVAIDCIYQPYDPMKPRCQPQNGGISCEYREWKTCTDRITADPTWGTPVSIWVYGEGGGFPISPTMTIPVQRQPLLASVVMTGVQIPTTDYAEGGHSDPRAARIGRMYGEDVKQPGSLVLDAVVGDKRGGLSVVFAAP